MLTHAEQAVGREIQRDLSLSKRPYRDIAEKLCLTEQEVLEIIGGMLAQGVVRKFAAIVRHRKVGYTANALVVWAVPKDRRQEVGQTLSTFSAVSHCYERSPALEEKYNLFSMLHMRTPKEIEDTVKTIAASIGVRDYRILVSEEEFKKSSMEYFS